MRTIGVNKKKTRIRQKMQSNMSALLSYYACAMSAAYLLTMTPSIRQLIRTRSWCMQSENSIKIKHPVFAPKTSEPEIGFDGICRR